MLGEIKDIVNVRQVWQKCPDTIVEKFVTIESSAGRLILININRVTTSNSSTIEHVPVLIDEVEPYPTLESGDSITTPAELQNVAKLVGGEVEYDPDPNRLGVNIGGRGVIETAHTIDQLPPIDGPSGVMGSLFYVSSERSMYMSDGNQWSEVVASVNDISSEVNGGGGELVSMGTTSIPTMSLEDPSFSIDGYSSPTQLSEIQQSIS